MAVLRRFHCILDLPGKALYLAPSPGAERLCPPLVDLGIYLHFIGGHVLVGVTADSLAYRCGLRRGDALVAIDGKPIASFAPGYIIYAHREVANRPVSLEVLDHDQSRTVRLQR